MNSENSREPPVPRPAPVCNAAVVSLFRRYGAPHAEPLASDGPRGRAAFGTGSTLSSRFQEEQRRTLPGRGQAWNQEPQTGGPARWLMQPCILPFSTHAAAPQPARPALGSRGRAACSEGKDSVVPLCHLPAVQLRHPFQVLSLVKRGRNYLFAHRMTKPYIHARCSHFLGTSTELATYQPKGAVSEIRRRQNRCSGRGGSQKQQPPALRSTRMISEA